MHIRLLKYLIGLDEQDLFLVDSLIRERKIFSLKGDEKLFNITLF